MIISNQQVQSILKNYGVAGGRRANYSNPVTPPNRQDKLELSPQAQEMNAIRQKIASLPEVRENRVDELKARIKNGDYQVDAMAVAQKMLDRSMVDELLDKS